MRPHQRLGTVEVRALDSQTDSAYTASLVALIQCVVATTEDHNLENPLFTAEDKWRAARFGMDATFYDFTRGPEIEARAMARSLVEKLRGISQDLDCEEELAGIREILARGTGAELQRAAFDKTGSLEGVVDHLVAGTVPG